MERLQKYLAHAGVASRRKAEQLILAGKVKVNRQIVQELGTRIEPNKDVVEVEGKIINEKEKLVYFLLNKPSGYMTTVQDEHNRPKVTDLVKDIKERIYPIGRLDYETEGLLLLTNDGDLAYQLTHPKHKVDKVYEALIEGKISQAALVKLTKGVMLEDGLTAPAQVVILRKWPHQTLVEITIWEGKNRQVRRMMAAVGHQVKYLKRTKVAFLELKSLEKGHYRSLTMEEVKKLKSL